jgi:hypothetical protein
MSWYPNEVVGVKICRRIKINSTITAELTFGPGGLTVEWSPYMPRRLSAAERRRYRRGRDQLVTELSAKMGANILVIET